MIVRDETCYPDSPERHVKIVAAENAGDLFLRVTFDDGEMRLFDGRVLTGEVFEPLKTPSAFADWKLDYETLTWNDGDIDISADYVLNHSQPIVRIGKLPEYQPVPVDAGVLRACEEQS